MIFQRFANFVAKGLNFPFKEDSLFTPSKKEDEISGDEPSRSVDFLEIILTFNGNSFNRLNYHLLFVNKIELILQ